MGKVLKKPRRERKEKELPKRSGKYRVYSERYFADEKDKRGKVDRDEFEADNAQAAKEAFEKKHKKAATHAFLLQAKKKQKPKVAKPEVKAK